MSERKPQVIVRERQLPASQDYAQLRERGQSELERLASDLWTDFNVHDPGISILEVLCYALTDLGFRAHLPVEDLLARADPEEAKDFFTAAEILTCNPVNIVDLRKVIIDRDGVRNAWLINVADPPASQARPSFHYRCSEEDPGYEIRLDPDVTDGLEPKVLSGLYDVTVQLEDHPRFPSLNSNVLEWRVDIGTETIDTKLVLPRLEVEFPSWDYPIVQALEFHKVTNPSVTSVDTSGLGVTFDWNLRFEAEDGTPLQFTVEGVRALGVPDASFPDLRALLESTAQDSLSGFFLRRTKTILEVLHDVYCALHEHRNLCEDFVRFSVVPSQEIGICAEIAVEGDTDVERVLGEIYFEIARFLSPAVRFYTLQEMRDRGKTVEEIFEGVVPENGFIDADELADTDLTTEVHVSDLYRIIMAHEEVVTVENLLVTNYLDGVAQTDGEPWCLELGGAFDLHLDPDKSTILFLNDGLPITADKAAAAAVLRDLEAQHDRPKLDLHERDISPPLGRLRNLSEYVSIHNEFPLVYGIGKDGLSPTAPSERFAQAKQLKAYLMLFDQLLANYLAQLADVKNLLSVDPPMPAGTQLADLPTYAVQPLYRRPDEPGHDDFPRVANLLQAFLPPPVGEAPPGGSHAPTSERPSFDDLEALASEWETFTDDNENGYLRALRSLVESEELRHERRNRFLDHLLARFAESFSEYAVLLRDADGVLLPDEDLIEDKQVFLSEYPELSAHRGRAFQLKCHEQQVGDPWRKDNVSGFKKRASRLLGIADTTRSSLGFATQDIDDHFVIDQTGGDWRFRLISGPEVLLHHDSPLSSQERAVEAAIDVVDLGIWRQSYEIREPTTGEFQVVLLDHDGNVVARNDGPLADVEVARNLIETTRDLLSREFYPEREGLHLFEHILLRPIREQTVTAADIEEGFFTECRQDDYCDCPVADHYSFRVTVVLPFWPQRFRDMDFRRHVERTIRREMPAHIVPRICWVGARDMFELERRFRIWLGRVSSDQPNRQLLSTAIRRLVKKLNTLTTVYPESRLHDCNAPEDGRVAVVLDQTPI